MICRTEALVLRTVPYGDTSLVVGLYTETYGRVDVLAKGARSPRARGRAAYLQPAQLIEAVYHHRPGRTLQTLTEVAPLAQDPTLMQPPQAVYATLLLEIVATCVKEEHPQPEVFSLVKDTLLALPGSAGGMYGLALGTLAQLCGHLGFSPEVPPNPPAHVVWDLPEGRWDATTPTAADPVAQEALRLFSSAQALQVYTPAPALRQALLQRLLDYYAQHIPGFSMPRSLEVWRQVLR